MDDDGAAASPSPSPSPSRSPSPLPVADPVTVAAAPPGHGHVAVAALPLRKPSPSSGGGGGGGGREDAWSEGATSTLIDAWGERFVALGRGSLRHPQWQEVAEVVSSRDGYSKPPKSDVQCKNRIDTLKKKYKVERSRHGASAWSYFDRLDDLLAPVYNKANSSSSAARNAGAAPMVPPRFSFPQRTRTPLQPSAAGAKRRMPSPPPQASASSDSSDGFPPEPSSVVANGKRQRMEGFPFAAAAAAACNGVESGSGSTSRALGLRDLAQAIRRLGEVYERVESSRRDQELRMERERLDAARELEDQRVQFFLKMQMELSKATGGGVGAPMAVAIPADGNGTRREGMTAEVATSSNHRVRYRIKGSGHHHAPPQPNYQNNAALTGGGGDSDSDKKEAEENAQDEEEESQ